MPKTTKPTDGEAPNKRTRKTATEAEASTKVVKAAKAESKSPKVKAAKPEPIAAPVAAEAIVPVAPAVKPVKEVSQMPSKQSNQPPSLEERVRIRAYELYLRRGGRGGSPEQDWFQAMSEIYRESVA
jgi:hypothetical protein